MITISGILVSFSAIIAILSKNSPQKIAYRIFKPLTTSLIIISAIFIGTDKVCEYKYFICIGLFFSLAGDILLLSDHRFLFGLISFLFAHVLFLTGFLFISNSFHIWILLFFLIFGGAVYSYLSPQLGRYKPAVIIYLIIILIMAWRGWEVYQGGSDTRLILIPLAAMLFLISDLGIAFRNFKDVFRYSEIIILGPYYLSIWLLAFSIQIIC